MILEGRIAIVRDSDDNIRIELTDQASSTLFAKAVLSLEYFALAVTGRGGIPCAIEVEDLEYLGAKREWRRILLPRPPNRSGEREQFIHELLVQYQKDGWVARASDFDNSHNWGRFEDGSPGIRVLFERWVRHEEA